MKFDDLFSFYQPSSNFHEPLWRTKGAMTKAGSDTDALVEIRRMFVDGGMSSAEIHKNKDAKDNVYKLAEAGSVFNSIYVPAVGSNEVWDEKYFALDGNNKSYIKTFYKEVCCVESTGKEKKSEPKPPVDFSVNILRAPHVTPGVSQDSQSVAMYLTHMPPIFANQLMPYCEVQMQIPKLPDTGGQKDYVNRPSLYRFLMGSGADISTLTEADRSLVTIQNIENNEINQSFERPRSLIQNSSFLGNEMFTSPQVLTNMDSLLESTHPSGARMNQVKPFLPPASLTNVTISQSNAGSGPIEFVTGELGFIIHDKARLPEFSEFLQLHAGYANIIIWITYGMLASSASGDYATFVNQNMLRRYAFTANNVSFSISESGAVDIKMQLASVFSGGLNIPIDYVAKADGLEDKFAKLDELKNRFKETLLPKFGQDRHTKPSNRDAYPENEVRVFDTAVAMSTGDVNFGDYAKDKKKKEELTKILQGTRDNFTNNYDKYNAAGKAADRGKDFEKDKAVELCDEIAVIYGIKLKGMSQEKIAELESNQSKSFYDQLHTSANDYINKKFNKESIDPFLPSVKHQKTFEPKKVYVRQEILDTCTSEGAQETITTDTEGNPVEAPPPPRTKLNQRDKRNENDGPVHKWQTFLIKKNYLEPVGKSGKSNADGFHGPGTEAASRKWEEAEKAAASAPAASAPAASAPTPAPTPAPAASATPPAQPPRETSLPPKSPKKVDPARVAELESALGALGNITTDALKAIPGVNTNQN